MDTPYATISVPMPLSVKISSRIACGMRPSITCVFLTPPSSAVRHACTLGSMPSLIVPFFTMLARKDVARMVKKGTISEGMLPKVQACLTALEGGVRKTHVIDGRMPHAILLEIFTDKGIGTEIVA